MLLIDGHNLIGRAPGLSMEREEEGREAVLRRVAALAPKGGPVVVIFDGDRPDRKLPSRFGAVRVAYSARGRTADEEILHRVAAKGRGVTVVTSDRALADRAHAHGAMILSAEAFWARARARATPDDTAAQKPDPTGDDVEQWLKLFSRAPSGK